MKILREFHIKDEVENILEENKETGEKNIIIKGVFAQANTQNRNGRIYPVKIMERECYKLQKMIAENKLVGELDHPEKPEVILQNAAIKITSLKQEGANFIGEARIMKGTPKGSIAYGLAKEGIQFGTSTRGLGSLEEKEGTNYVKEDFNWLTNDLVSDPSGIDCWVDSIMEKAEYYIENGYIKEDVYKTYKNRLKSLSKEEGDTIKEKLIGLYADFLNSI